MTRVAACDLLVALVAVSAFMPAEARVVDEMASRLGAKRLSAGAQGDHTCFVRADGNVLCWGNNASGQIGDGTSGNVRNAPTPTGITTAAGVAVGSDHSCALLSTGLVQCWGSNATGQLGVGQATTASTTPVTVPGLTGATSIAAGTGFSCARKSDGTVRCWGRNTFGQLGDDTTTSPRFGPVQVANLTDAAVIVAGATHACAIRGGGALVCWGGNGQGQLGIGNTSDRDVPTAVADLAEVTDIAAGLRFTCASRTNSNPTLSVFCWGDNDLGQNATGVASNNATQPTQTVFNGAGELVAGETHACLIDLVQLLRCWGGNDAGQLGDGSTSQFSATPRLTLAVVIAAAAGRKHSCALTSNDIVRCWGDNSLGQLGNLDDAPAASPTTVSGLAGSVSARRLAVGTNHTCAVRADGAGACWGRNDGAAIGDGTFTDRLVPTTISSALLTGFQSFITIAGGGNHTCSRVHFDFSGQGTFSACWGDNRQSQGSPSASSDFLAAPQYVTVPQHNQSAGAFHTCGSFSNNVTCWGLNESLALGDADPSVDSSANVGGLTNVVATATGLAHSCALLSTGRVSCWGGNDFGQLGDGTRNDSAEPREVGGVAKAVAIATTRDHSCALLATGQVACWGRNDFGQVDGTLGGDRSVGTLVPGIGPGVAVGVTAGAQHTCILTAGGRVRCWGRNNNGQLGNNTTVSSLAPVEVLRASKVPTALANVVALVSDAEHNCALLTTGQPYCWGRNPEGQLGDGTRTRRLTALGVDSFAANVVRNAQLVSNGRVVEIVALVNCPADSRFTGRIFVTQGDVRANKAFNGACTDGLSEYPVDVHAQGPQGFTQGEALAEIDLVVHGRGGVIDDQHWTRRIDLASPTP